MTDSRSHGLYIVQSRMHGMKTIVMHFSCVSGKTDLPGDQTYKEQHFSKKILTTVQRDFYVSFLLNNW